MKPQNPDLLRWMCIGLLLLGGIFCLPQAGWAQQEEMSVGVGFGLVNKPEDAGLDRSSQAVDLSFDWLAFRFGYNQITHYADFALYDYDWTVQLETQGYYGAWRYDITEEGGLYALLGLTYQSYKLSLGNSVADQSSDDFGLLYGLGTQFDLDGLYFGLQWSYFSVPGLFRSEDQPQVADINLAAGSNQLQFTARIPF